VKEHVPMHDENRGADRFKVDANASTHFAWLRTRLSAERTLMSYDRTAIALIGFGFTIYQFLAKLNVNKDVAPARHINAPQLFGLLLIGSGLAFLIIGLINYRSFIRYLHVPAFHDAEPTRRERWHSGTPLVSAFLILAGVFAFVAVLLRV
jgi:putative membrane protein